MDFEIRIRASEQLTRLRPDLLRRLERARAGAESDAARAGCSTATGKVLVEAGYGKNVKAADDEAAHP